MSIAMKKFLIISLLFLFFLLQTSVSTAHPLKSLSLPPPAAMPAPTWRRASSFLALAVSPSPPILEGQPTSPESLELLVPGAGYRNSPATSPSTALQTQEQQVVGTGLLARAWALLEIFLLR